MRINENTYVEHLTWFAEDSSFINSMYCDFLYCGLFVLSQMQKNLTPLPTLKSELLVGFHQH